jgi:hypothetical protein
VKLEQSASITIVENKKVTCKTCLISEITDMPEIVICRLNQEAKQKHEDEFCAQGLWLYNGTVLEFKEIFKQIYAGSKEKNSKDLKKE